MNNKPRSISEVADRMDSNSMIEFLAGYDDNHEIEFARDNSKRTWLEKLASSKGLSGWKKKYPKATAWLALVSLVLAFVVTAGFLWKIATNPQSYSFPSLVGGELFLVAVISITTLLNYGLFRDRQISAERVARCLALVLGVLSVLLPIGLIAVFLFMLGVLVVALYQDQGIATNDLLGYIGSLVILWFVIFLYLGFGVFLYFPRTRLGYGVRRPRIMRWKLRFAVIENFMWNFSIVAAVLCVVFSVKALTRDSNDLSESKAPVVVADISDVFVGVMVSGALALVVSGWRIHGRVMDEVTRVIERALVLLRKVEAGEDWRTLGVGDLEAIDLVLDLEKILGKNLCSGWYPLHVSIESLNYRTILCREMLLILGVHYRTLVPQFESKNWLLERYGIGLGGSIAGVAELMAEFKMLNDQLKKWNWKRFVNS